MALYKGLNTRVTFGGTAYGVTEWTAKHVCAKEEVTDTESDGKEKFEGLTERIDWTCKFVFDASSNPLTMAPNVTAGSQPAVRLFLHKTDPNKFIDMPKTQVDDVDISANAKGLVEVTITGSSNGTFTLPS